MNKKGFTLIELLVVIAILALLVIIVATKGFGIFDKSKDEISKEAQAEIEEAVSVLMTEIEHCEDEEGNPLLKTGEGSLASSNDLLKDKSKINCEDLQKASSESKDKDGNVKYSNSLKIPLKYLIDNNYISGSNANKLYESNKDKNIVYTGQFILEDGSIKYENGEEIFDFVVDDIKIECIDCNYDHSEGGNVVNTPSDNPYSSGTLAYQIFDSAKNATGSRSVLKKDLSVSVDVGPADGEKYLASTDDLFGKSYYFRGNVEDNYIEFANMCFRIVRVEGDGSVKLVFAGDSSCSGVTNSSGNIDTQGLFGINLNNVVYGYNGDYADYLNYKKNVASEPYGVKEILDLWFFSKLSTYETQIKDDTWCLGGNINNKYGENADSTQWYYAAGDRLNNDKRVNLKCENDNKFNSKIGLLSVDEVIFAGGKNEKVSNYYLNDESSVRGYYLLSLSDYYYSKGYTSDFVFVTTKTGKVTTDYISENVGVEGVRPVISLLNNVTYKSGNGTKTNPYHIN